MARKNYNKNVNLDEKAKLYKGFRTIGGKVVKDTSGEFDQAQDKILAYDDYKSHEQEVLERQKEMMRKKRLELAKLAEKRSKQEQNHEKKLNKTSKNVSTHKTSTKVKTPSKTTSVTAPRFSFSVWIAKWVCILNQVFRFFNKKFTRMFFNLTLKDLRSALTNSQKILTSVLHQDQVFTDKLQDRLNRIGRPYYFELIYRFDAIFEPDLFSSIQDVRGWKNQWKQGRSHFIRLFKKLYALRKYVPVLNHALSSCLILEGKMRAINPEVVKSNVLYLQKKVNYVFHHYYPKIMKLMEYYYKVHLLYHKKDTFKQFLHFTKEDTMGYYTRLWKEQKEMEERKRKIKETLKRKEIEETSNQDVLEKIKTDSDLDSDIKEGLGIIYHNCDFNRMHEALKKSKDPMAVMELKDKSFLIFTLIEFFYQHYSYIFLSNQVKFNVFFDKSGVRLDIKNSMRDLYFKMNSIYQRIREYVRVILELKKLTHDFEIEVDDKYPEVKKVVNQRTDLLRIINYEVRGHINKFSKILSYILKDYNEVQKILQNPDDYIPSKTKNAKGLLLGSKKRIHEVINEAYTFCEAFVFLLSEADLNTAEMTLEKPEYLRLTPFTTQKSIDYENSQQHPENITAKAEIEHEKEEAESTVDKLTQRVAGPTPSDTLTEPNESTESTNGENGKVDDFSDLLEGGATQDKSDVETENNKPIDEKKQTIKTEVIKSAPPTEKDFLLDDDEYGIVNLENKEES